jgi:hypothetical protein
MQCHHLYNARHVTRATNAATTYQIEHEIIDNDMV